jgi:hypothetical protein
MNKYLVKLYFFDPNVESFLHANEVYVLSSPPYSGELRTIWVETKLSELELLNKCSGDIVEVLDRVNMEAFIMKKIHGHRHRSLFKATKEHNKKHGLIEVMWVNSEGISFETVKEDCKTCKKVVIE